MSDFPSRFARNQTVFAAIVVGLIAVTAISGSSATPTEKTTTLPRSPLALAELPPGAVRPGGWLRDWALMAANGITGHLDERSNVYDQGWNGKPITARGARPDGTGWPLEQSSYWLDGGIRLAYILNDERLKAKIGARLDQVVNGVLNGGETFIYWLPRSAVDSPFNSWAHSQMGRALVAYYQCSRDPRVLAALVKVYRNFKVPAPGANGKEVVTGAVNLDPMIDTYLLSGESAILESIRVFAQDPGYQAMVTAWTAEKISATHGVAFYEESRLPALLAPWTANRADLLATQHALAWLDRTHGLPIGLAASEEFHAGIGATRNVETCNVAAATWTYLWLLRITGQREYGDRVEEIFFNAAPAPVDREFQTLAYFQSPNRYSQNLPAEWPEHPSHQTLSSYLFTPLGHPVLCCVGNINRIIPYYISHLWMGTPDGGLAATLYGPGTVKASVGTGQLVEVTAKTSYPFDETITLQIAPEQAAAFPLYLRIPRWCASPEIMLNGRRVEATATSDGFVCLSRTWRAGDEVRLRLPMSVVYRQGRETPYPQISYFEKSRSIARQTDLHSPFATVSCGPLLFVLPIADVNANTAAPDAGYNYALEFPESATSPDVEVIRHAMPERWTWQLDAPVQLSVWMRRFDWNPTELQPLPAQPVAGGDRVRVRLVPYGCAKFRVAMFPVAAGTPAPRLSR